MENIKELNCFCCGNLFVYDELYTHHCSPTEADKLGIAEFDPICDDCYENKIKNVFCRIRTNLRSVKI